MTNGGIKLNATTIVGALLFIVMSLGVFIFKTGIDVAADDRARLFSLIETAIERQAKIQEHQARIEIQMVKIMAVVEEAHR